MDYTDLPVDTHGRLIRPPEIRNLTLYQKQVLWACLNYYEKVAIRTWQYCSTLPKSDRPDWFDNHITYWKHLARGLRWIQRTVAAIGCGHASAPRYSSKATNTILSEWSDETTIRHSIKLRDWFEPL